MSGGTVIPAQASLGCAMNCIAACARRYCTRGLFDAQNLPQRVLRARRERHHIRRDAVILVRDDLARPAHAGLHFIQYEDQVLLVAQVPQGLYVRLISYILI